MHLDLKTAHTMMPKVTEPSQQPIRDFWNADVCGTRYAVGESLPAQLRAHAERRYALEPYIFDFARFADGAGKRVLEVGVGLGADHLQWARAKPSYLAGVDLAPRAIEMTRSRLQLEGLQSDLYALDAASLPFSDSSFDIIYSWGVIHHAPSPEKCLKEVLRVLKPSGTARIMLYHKNGYLFRAIWLRYSIFAGHPFRSVDAVIADKVESPGTKAYDVGQVKELFRDWSSVSCRPARNHGDLFEGDIGARHRGLLLSVTKRLWPRWLIRRAPERFGSYLLIEATK